MKLWRGGGDSCEVPRGWRRFKGGHSRSVTRSSCSSEGLFVPMVFADSAAGSHGTRGIKRGVN